MVEPTDQYANIDIDLVDVRDLVLSYLVHNCYKDTLDCLVNDSSSCTRLALQNTYIDERKSMLFLSIYISSLWVFDTSASNSLESSVNEHLHARLPLQNR